MTIDIKIKQPAKKSTKLLMTAITAITIIECFALSKGINGTMLRIVIVIISMLAGLALPVPRILRV